MYAQWKIFQYEIGKEYKEDKADLCHCGFHACENPLDVLSYYTNIDDKFCEVELDKIDPNRNKDSKICGKKIKIGIEIGFLGLFKAGIEWIKNKTIFTKEDFKKLPSSYNAKISSSDYNAKIGSSSDYARIGSSGEYVQIGSSGNGTKIGSSGSSAKIGSSGDDAQISSSGDDCVIMCAGINSSAKAKIGSCGDICHTLYGVSYDPKLCCGKEDDAFYIGTHFIDLYRDYLLLE